MHKAGTVHEFWRAIVVFMDNLIDPETLCSYAVELEYDRCLAVGYSYMTPSLSDILVTM